jgi:putative transposase
MRLAIGKAHQCYTRRINLRERWLGHLWQGRFSSFVLGEDWLLAAVHYIERNPVKAGLVANATEWPWSSARAHVLGREDVLVKAEGPILEYVPPDSWEEFLSAPSRAEEVATLSRHGRTGRPLGDAGFVAHLEQLLGRPLARHKPGPKPGHCKGR